MASDGVLLTLAIAAAATFGMVHFALTRRHAKDSAPLKAVPPHPSTLPPAAVVDSRRRLLEVSNEILALLKKYEPVVVDGVGARLHYLAPHVPKAKWSELGGLVAAREKSSSSLVAVGGAEWVSLRLDGKGFSKVVKKMRASGALESGAAFSERFAECMVAALRGLMETFPGAAVGYTQSDEMLVLIKPASVVRGERQCHTFGGRVAKTSTLAAGFVTSKFVLELSRRIAAAGGDPVGCLAEVVPHFDCRLGAFESWEEAQALLLWRAYDCSVNGLSDAVHQATATEHSSRAVRRLGTREKVAWLAREGRLPLPPHQAYGAVLVRATRRVSGFNPVTGEAVEAIRGVVEHAAVPQSSVLEMARAGRLLPASVL